MKSKFDFTGKTAVITGGAGEIGGAMAAALKDAGAKIFILDKVSTGTSESIEIDLTDTDRIRQVINRIGADCGRIDILVHSAGVNFHKSFDEVDEETWDVVNQVNLRSAFFLAQAARKYMKNGGKIIFVSSVSAQLAYYGLHEYCASKGGLEALTRSLAVELAADRICVNAIAPGTTKTGMTKGLWGQPELKAAHEATIPLGRMAVPEDHANLTLFLASNLADYVNGAIIPCDGGLAAMQADFINLKLRTGAAE